ncbi:hypothetical protein RMSM_06961 [Rhodopirellula maiorica SM1]|uniref:Uncharacterized protein n=1 Tax=Rhodopirellula maiorica SM1 TaxID=1265738 RepID=M5RQ88_9BACT|nr:hypothetical protein [Rhodopirellula maiorica]EMI16124.1 hypothetical protein RMSM_06961 [Rhodopirellula maiorica SM1]
MPNSGICVHDLEDVLHNAEVDLVVDWRSSLQDVTPIIATILEGLHIEASIDLFGEDLNEATMTVDDKNSDLKFVTRDDDDFDTVIATVNSLIRSTASFRKFRSW